MIILVYLEWVYPLFLFDMNVEETVRKLAEPALEERNIELIKVDFLKLKGKYRLVLTLDKFNGGISVDELTEASETVSAVLDENEAIKGHYDLDVSSPGIERPLYSLKDYERFAGKKVKVIFKEQVGDLSSFEAVIESVNGSVIELEESGKRHNVEFKNIKKGHLVYDIREDLR